MSDGRPWRTNVGLRLSRELGEWFEERCKAENRTYSNYIETLLIRDRASPSPSAVEPLNRKHREEAGR